MRGWQGGQGEGRGGEGVPSHKLLAMREVCHQAGQSLCMGLEVGPKGVLCLELMLAREVWLQARRCTPRHIE